MKSDHKGLSEAIHLMIHDMSAAPYSTVHAFCTLKALAGPVLYYILDWPAQRNYVYILRGTCFKVGSDLSEEEP